jgi:tripartite-type tricarboxylate transporter receptor subunit TctC
MTIAFARLRHVFSNVLPRRVPLAPASVAASTTASVAASIPATASMFGAVVALLCTGGLALHSAPAAAQDFPSKPITLVVPFPPGGPTDSSARLFGKVMSERLGQPIIIDNRAGAGGTVGTSAVTRAQPDGYTLLWGGTSSIVVAPALYSNLQYDPVKSFTPVGMAVRGPLILVSRAEFPAKNLQELLAYSKSHSLTVASAGTGSIDHLAAELFKNTADVNWLHVPYRGGAPAMTDVMGGQVDLLFDTVTLLYPQIAAGKLRAYATTGPQRYSKLPDVPTVAEALGKPFEASSWFGLLAPAGTPAPVAEKLAQAMSAAAKDPAVIKQLEDLGLEPVGGTPAEYAQTIKTDLAKWSQIVKLANVKPD